MSLLAGWAEWQGPLHTLGGRLIRHPRYFTLQLAESQCRCSTEMSPQLLNRNVTPRSPAPRSRRVGDVKRFASRGAWGTEHGLTPRGPGEGGAPCGGYRESGPPRDRAA